MSKEDAAHGWSQVAGVDYYRHVSTHVTPQSRQIASFVRFETNRLHEVDPVVWRFRQPKASLFWWETGFDRYEVEVDGAPTRADVAERRPFGFVPPGAAVKGEHHVDADCVYHILFIDPGLLEVRGRATLDEPLVGFSDTALQRSIRDLSKWRDDATFPLMAEGWALQTIARIQAKINGAGMQPRGYGLADVMLRRVDDYVRSRLHDSIGLVELSALAGLSVRHFSRAFRTSTGQTPARFVHNRRIAAAREMLLRPDTSITEIAFACGFSHAQHFANSFRRAVGLTPSEYRQSLGP